MIVLLFIYTWGFRIEWMNGFDRSSVLRAEKKHHSSLSAVVKRKLKTKSSKGGKKGNSSINCFSFDQKRVTHSGEKGPVTNADKKKLMISIDGDFIILSIWKILSLLTKGNRCVHWATDLCRALDIKSHWLHFRVLLDFSLHASSLCHFSTLPFLFGEFSSFSSLSNNFPF